MNIDRAEEFAAACPTPLEAKRLYNDVEYELAMGGIDNEDQYEALERALSILRERFPDVETEAHTVTEPPHLSRTAWKGMRQGDHPHPDDIPKLPQEAFNFEPQPLLSRGARRALRVGLAVVGLGLAGLAVTLGTAPGACSKGTYDTSVLTEYCVSPTGQTLCYISAQGFSPNPNDVPPGTTYSATGPDAPWCADALPPR